MAKRIDLNFHQNKKLRVLYNKITQDFKDVHSKDKIDEVIEDKLYGINGLSSLYKAGEEEELIKDLILIILTRA